MKDLMTREQAELIVGRDIVSSLDYVNCEPTGRCGYNGKCHGDELCEWSATVSAIDGDGICLSVTAYYYTTNEEDENMESIDWVISGYEIS